MVAVATTVTSLASTYVGYGTYIGLGTGTTCGTVSTPSSEATGGSPAYARKATSWSATTAGIQTGTAQTIDVAAATYTFMLLASSSTGNNMFDNASITSVVMGAQGQIVVTPTITFT